MNDVESLLKRKLQVEKMIDTIQVPEYNMFAKIMPLFIPQVQDSRIKVQTFNPPPKPITPGLLPNPHFSAQLNLPQKEDPPHITKEINIFSQKTLNKELDKIVHKAFYKALNKLGMGRFKEGKEKIFKLNVFDSPTDRLLTNEEVYEKTQRIVEKLNGIMMDYKSFEHETLMKIKGLEKYVLD